MSSIAKYVNRYNKEVVTAFKYNNINDFDTLFQLIGDIHPSITAAHTRIYEGNWIIRHANNHIEYLQCGNDDKCFTAKYDTYK